jgi:hypothetical protein
MENDTKAPSTAASVDDEAKFKIDFIDPLFAVAIHIGFVESLLKEAWLEHRAAPTEWGDIANLLMFVAAFLTIVASWIGYHKSISNKPIIGQMRFLLDILLLAFYIFLFLYFKHPLAVSIILTIIYTLYIAWDFYKTKEYPLHYYASARPPNGFVYLARCLAEWLLPGKHSALQSEAVTAGWTIFFAILIPYAFFPTATSEVGKCGFAGILMMANLIYRYDKISRGAWICSIPFKLLMGAMVAYLILYHTKVLCSGA